MVGTGLGAALTRLVPSPRRLEEVPLEVLRQRESKWLDMLNNWDKWMAKKHKKVGDPRTPGGARVQRRPPKALGHVPESPAGERPRRLWVMLCWLRPASSPGAAPAGCRCARLLPAGFRGLVWLRAGSPGNC